MKKHLLIYATMLMVVSAIAIAGCENRTAISRILDRPDHYMDKTVTIGGTVDRVYGVDLLITEIGAYQVDDGTGRIWVIARTDLPKEGDEVGLKGKVAGGFKMLGQTFGAVIREDQRRIRH